MQNNDIKVKSFETILVDTHRLRTNYIRKQYFQPFLEANYNLLLSLYNTEFTPELKEDISFDSWCLFAFQQTSDNGIRSYK